MNLKFNPPYAYPKPSKTIPFYLLIEDSKWRVTILQLLLDFFPLINVSPFFFWVQGKETIIVRGSRAWSYQERVKEGNKLELYIYFDVDR